MAAAHQYTREALRDLTTNGHGRVVLLLVNTTGTPSSFATNNARRILERLGWTKVGGEGDYEGMRGTYTRYVPYNGDHHREFMSHVIPLHNEARNELTVAATAVGGRIHTVIAETLLYDDAIINLLALPEPD